MKMVQVNNVSVEEAQLARDTLWYIYIYISYCGLQEIISSRDHNVTTGVLLTNANINGELKTSCFSQIREK